MSEVHVLNLLRILSALLIAAMPLASALAMQATPATAPVLLLSDIHLDPFHDPAKFPALLAASPAGWATIFDASSSPTQATDFDKLQAACGSKGVDTPIALLESALKAAHAQQPAPLFITVSGDLMAHQFDCRFHTLHPAGTPAEYSAFAAKTVAFVALQLHLIFPRTPIYLTLGNNDSGCKDYNEDPNSAFLQADGKSFAADSLTPGNTAAITAQFSTFGDYNIALPIPHTRLLAMQDIFESKKYATCEGKPAAGKIDPAAMQVSWLRKQLTAARAAHDHVWVMAHIPPGVDAYTTFTKGKNICGGKDPELFLSSDDLAATLAEFPDVIRLALFGHTHMDELRLYRSPDGTPIPGKLVPSISPVNGNTPAFTLAQVNPSTATLIDYTVFTAGGAHTDPTAWTPEYTFSSTYHLPDLSGPSLNTLLTSFVADKGGSTQPAMDYQRLFSAGTPDPTGTGKAAIKAAAMKMVWPTYACSMTNASSPGFRDCLCRVGQGFSPDIEATDRLRALGKL
jgi:sphingomyelin phosphodiesterase acid-like 3